MKKLTVYVKTNELNQITGWSSYERYGKAIEVSDEDFEYFNESGGHKFRVEDGQAVLDENLPPIVFEEPKTEIEIIREAVEFLLLNDLEEV